ncbi:MAG TPA: hypothetical protein VJ697_14660 [Nitrososphaeraceae archaeon]|nr:hypothetical protein [Nitrososphaeraceae archaeon]
MYNVYLSYNQLKEFLLMLVENDHIDYLDRT